MASIERPDPPTHILETILYVKDVAKSFNFYHDIIGLSNPTFNTPRGANLSFGNHTLILFKLGLTTEDIYAGKSPEQFIPSHGPTSGILQQLVDKDGNDIGNGERLKQHFCFAVPKREDVDTWAQWLKQQNVEILSMYDWPSGGRSVYFLDPDGHIGEFGSRGIWPFY